MQDRSSMLFCLILWLAFLHNVNAFLSPWRAPSADLSRAAVVDVVLEDPLILLTPATAAIVNDLVQNRDQARKMRNFQAADALLHQISNDLELPSDCSIRVTDTTEGSGWSVLYHVSTENNTTSVLQLAHMALGSRIAASEQHNWNSAVALNDDARDRLVQQAKQRLQAWSRVHSKLLSSHHHNHHRVFLETPDLSVWASVECELQGRKSADAAFWFALAGVVDEELFQLLTEVVCKELTRFGTRPSCRLKDVLSMAKRMAAAGVRRHTQLEQVLQTCLDAKDATTTDAVLSFHSDGCALMLWEFSTRQRKQRSFLDQAARHWTNNHVEHLEMRGPTPPPLDWNQRFQDPHLPLVIDVGCGMGVSLLGLASLSAQETNWQGRNFLGIDLNPVTIGYASGIAQRWNLSDRLAFVVGAAESVLHDVLDSYPGPVSQILIQFPTPYRLGKLLGNSQLPRSATDGFMVSVDLLRLCRGMLSTSGELWIQSNCEDVAVWIRKTACEEAGFVYRKDDDFLETPAGKETQRTLQWIEMGGERAQGPGWCATHLLPRQAMTETEVACILKGTPVHRCILTPRTQQDDD